MKIIAFVGSVRKKHTYNATERFLQKLKAFGDIEYEIIPLSDYRLEVCKGCKLCFDKGEEFCPLKDDRDILVEKINNSDGVVFASPNYSFQVSALMKIFLDRLAYNFHRPCFFGKTFTTIVVEGVYGAKEIIKYLNFVGLGLGFNIVKGCSITTREPITEKQKKKNESIIDNQSKLFYSRLIKERFPNPSLLGLLVFGMTRSNLKILFNETNRDYTFFKENGYFESDYYYPVKLNLFKKLIGRFSDMMGTKMAKNTIKMSSTTPHSQ
jgi:multimeric flavodoxin WrbA